MSTEEITIDYIIMNVLKSVIVWLSKHRFTYPNNALKRKGNNMTDNENELINLIHSHKHPKQALTIAIETILNFLEQPQSSPTP